VAAAVAAALAGAQVKAAVSQAKATAAADAAPLDIDIKTNDSILTLPAELAAAAPAPPETPPPAASQRKTPEGAQSARFFLRGVGKLGEHHLKDYFEKYGNVVEATLVRDKKTQRPRGMAFVTLAPKEEGGVISDLVDKILDMEQHAINDVKVELQEALPKIDKDDEKKDEQDAATGATAAANSAAAPAQEAVEMDPAQVAQAQAQWQMHYLALAINASVPEVAALPAAESGPGKSGKNGFGKGMSGKGPGEGPAGGKGWGKARAKPY